MIELIKQELNKKYKAKKIDLLKARGGGQGKIIFFAFLNDALLPFLCLKISNIKSDNKLIESEYQNLVAARNSLPESLKRTIPEPMGLWHIDDRLVSCEEAIAAKETSSKADRQEIEELLAWLGELHRHNVIGTQNIDRSFLVNLFGGYQKLVPALQNETRFLPDIENFVAHVWPQGQITEMPLIRQHGDLHFANVFWQNGFLKVVDWANFGRVNLPAYDLIFFLRRQKNGLARHGQLLEKYFELFSLPKDIISAWLKITLLLEGLDKWSRAPAFADATMFAEYFKEIFLWAKK